MAEKVKIYIDGEEILGLVWKGERVLESGTIEVPEFRRTRIIQNGITKIPMQEMRYKIARGTSTDKFFRDWKQNDEIKDVVVVYTDAHGDEFARDMMPQCECIKLGKPEVDLATPTFAQIAVTLLPWDIIPLDGE
jgi:hypothetical protein